MSGQVTFQWFGHSCFRISTDKLSVVTDPFDKSVGYPVPSCNSDVITVSHEHFDHNNVSCIKRGAAVVKSSKNVKGVDFSAIQTSHDEAGGSKRGKNNVFVWLMEGIKIAHLGDLGHILTSDQVAKLGGVDVLLIPVGGYYTIDPKEADSIISQLKPKVVIPMHYKTEVMGENFPIVKVSDFTSNKKNVVKVGKNTITFEKDKLPKETTVYVLEYK
ncbi:MAG: MBL fold metallo-hydrolase [candidate division Zixibacteria bacterium]|nr:MBL fold metallo-hydrolase [candidate division Zixibacteria bacterium]